MVSVFIFISIILFILTFPFLVLLIVSLIDKDDVNVLYQGCPEIYTIGDLIDACRWRVRNTDLGIGLSIPILGFIFSLFIVFLCIFDIFLRLLIKFFLLLFRVDLKKIFNNCFTYWKRFVDRFRNITIFKNNEDVKNKEGEDKNI